MVADAKRPCKTDLFDLAKDLYRTPMLLGYFCTHGVVAAATQILLLCSGLDAENV